MTLNDPELVRREYASEAGLEARRSLYENREGPDPRDALWDAIVQSAPRHVLEVGPGPGEVSERMVKELSVDVVAVDISERMVELAREKGVDARVGDVQALPFCDGSFDLVVAAWMLFHVPDLDQGIAEIRRVLRPGGRLVAVTNSEHHLREARTYAGVSMTNRVTFSRENGEGVLRRYFVHVERRDVDGWVTFPDAEAIRSYLRSTVTMRDAAARVPELNGPLRAGTRNTVFVADKAT